MSDKYAITKVYIDLERAMADADKAGLANLAATLRDFADSIRAQHPGLVVD